MKNVFLLILFFLFINHSSAQTIDEYRNVVEYFRYNKELRKQLKYLTRSKKLIYQKDKGIKFKVSPQIIRVHYSNFENQINEFNIFNKNLDINDFAAISMRDLENRRLKKLQSLSTDGSSRLILFFSEAYKNTLTGEFFIISTYPNGNQESNSTALVHRSRRLAFLVVFDQNDEVKTVYYYKYKRKNTRRY